MVFLGIGNVFIFLFYITKPVGDCMLMTVHNFSTQYSTDSLPSYLQTTII